MYEQLNNFIPLGSTMMNTLTYLNILQNSSEMSKGQPTTIVPILGQTWLLEQIYTQAERKSNLSKSERKTIYNQINY